MDEQSSPLDRFEERFTEEERNLQAEEKKQRRLDYSLTFAKDERGAGALTRILAGHGFFDDSISTDLMAKQVLIDLGVYPDNDMTAEEAWEQAVRVVTAMLSVRRGL